MEMLVDIAIPVVVIMMMFQGFTCRVESPRESLSIQSTWPFWENCAGYSCICSAGRMSSALTSPEIDGKLLNSCPLSASMGAAQGQLDYTCLKAHFDSKVV